MVQLTAEDIEGLQAKGVITPEQANQYKIANNAFDAAPTKQPDKFDSYVASGSMTQADADRMRATGSPVAAPTPPPPQTPASQPAPASVPAAVVAQQNPNAPLPLRAYGTPPPAPIGGSVVAPSNIPNIPSADITSGPEGKDTRAKVINDKYDSAKDSIQSQLDALKAGVEDGSADPNYANKSAALMFQLHQLDSNKAKALQANDASFAAYKKDANGNDIVDPTAIKGTLTPMQAAALNYQSAKAGQGNVDRGIDQERKGYEAQIAAETAKNDATAASLTNVAQTMKSNALDKAARDAVFQTQIQQKNAEINRSIQDFNSSKVDPNAYWEQKSTGGLLGTALMAGLVGGLNAANGIQGNQVLSRIDQIINNDIDAQKTNIENKGKGVQMQSNALATFERQGYDREQAIAMTQAAGYDAAATQLKSELAKLSSPDAQAKGQIILGQLQQASAQRAEQAMAPAVQQLLHAKTVVPGAGANSGFITSMVGGKLMVKNVKTGQISEANDDQKAKYYTTEKNRAETAKTESTIGAPPKQNFRQTNLLATSSGLPKLTAAIKEPYSSGGLNTFSTTDTDAKLNQWASAVSAATKVPVDVIIHNVKNPILNSSSEQIIDHYAKDAEEKREYYEKNPSAVPGAGESEDAGETGNGE